MMNPWDIDDGMVGAVATSLAFWSDVPRVRFPHRKKYLYGLKLIVHVILVFYIL